MYAKCDNNISSKDAVAVLGRQSTHDNGNE